MFFGQGKSWKLEPWNSDAQFLYWGGSPDASRRTLIACHATFVEYGGRQIIRSEREVLRCEIIENGNQFEVVSSSPGVVVNDEELRMALTEDKAVPAGSSSAVEKKI